MTATAGVLGLLLVGCGAPVPDDPAPSPDAVEIEPAESPYAVVPQPGRTIMPTPPSDDTVPQEWRIAVVAADDEAATHTMRVAVEEFAKHQGVEVEEFVGAEGSADVAFADAVAADADVVIGLGEGTSDVFAYETSQWLDQQFLILGAQVAEPTDNVTAVVWDGATSRGSGAPADGELDPGTVTPEHASDSVAAGLNSVAEGITGVVLHLGE